MTAVITKIALSDEAETVREISVGRATFAILGLLRKPHATSDLNVVIERVAEHDGGCFRVAPSATRSANAEALNLSRPM